MSNVDETLADASHTTRAPKEIPDEWRHLFMQLTGPDSAHEWGLRAAIAITRFRKVNKHGPSFAQLFDTLLELRPHVEDEDSNRRVQKLAIYRFRHHVAIHWRRLGWIEWNHSARSLRAGRAFRAASRAWAKSQSLSRDSSARH